MAKTKTLSNEAVKTSKGFNLNIRLTDQEIDTFRFQAEKNGMNVSEYIKYLVLVDGKCSTIELINLGITTLKTLKKAE